MVRPLAGFVGTLCMILVGCPTSPTWSTREALQEWVDDGVWSGIPIEVARSRLDGSRFDPFTESKGDEDGLDHEIWRRVESDGFCVNRIYRVTIRHDGESVVDTSTRIDFVGS
jgi:hypothetical protein